MTAPAASIPEPPVRRVAAEPGDAVAAAILFATALVIAQPIWTTGYLTYIDNPVHLAEIIDLARHGAETWSEIAFTGFPVGTLHSPLWYSLLTLATEAGIPLRPVYTASLLLGFCAPAAGVYAVARRRTDPWRAGLLSYLVLVQPTMIVGIGSPLGGMWTHALAAAGVAVLADLWSRPRLTARQHWFASCLLALVALTHLFALIVAVALFAIAAIVHRRNDPTFAPELMRRLGGAAIAAMASAAYWLTFWLTVDPTKTPWDALDALELLVRFALPSDVLYLLESQPARGIRWDLYLTETVPLLALPGLAVVAVIARKSTADRLLHVSVWLAFALTAALLINPHYPVRVLGPVSWRLLLWIRIACALAAACWIDAIPLPRARTFRYAAAAATVVSGWWWGLPLRRVHGPALHTGIAETRALWRWLGDRASTSWGRIYLQDTFGQRWSRGGLDQSHLLALTAKHTEVPQLGVYYGVVPYKTVWTLSEFSKLYGSRRLTDQGLLLSMEKTNASHLVTSSPATRKYLSGMPELDRVYDDGRYSVFRRESAENDWISELRPTNRVSDVVYQRGHVEFDLSTEFPRGRVLVKTSWHPWWRLEGAPGAKLVESPEGFLVVDGLEVGEYHITLSYEPSLIPLATTLAGWGLWLAWGAILFRRRKASAPDVGRLRLRDAQ